MVGKPAQCGKGDHAVSTDHNQTLQAVADSRKPGLASLRANAIFKHQMTAFDLDSYPIPAKGFSERLGSRRPAVDI